MQWKDRHDEMTDVITYKCSSTLINYTICGRGDGQWAKPASGGEVDWGGGVLARIKLAINESFMKSFKTTRDARERIASDALDCGLVVETTDY